jgi:very-short-patch-repair endonuclease
MENLFSCPVCNKEFTTWNGLAKHTSRNHSLSGKELVMKYYKMLDIPKCKCGCGTECTFDKGHSKFREYTKGHLARTNGGFYSKKGGDKSAETRRVRFKSGEIIQWNKGKSYTPEQLKSFQEAAIKPERRKKISDGLKGKPKSPEHINNLRLSRIKWMSENQTKYESKLETEFKTILDALQIKYNQQYPVKYYCYDFNIQDTNILIETDGDWWHCNPNKGFIPLYESQIHTVAHDKVKNEWAEKNGYTLIRFWEDDIMNNRDLVIQKLLDLKTNIR